MEYKLYEQKRKDFISQQMQAVNLSKLISIIFL